MKTHKMSNHPIHKAWMKMNSRCNNPNYQHYHRYGGRGINICKRWERFEDFYSDMKDTWRPGLTLERNDNDKDYEPTNCRWASWEEQFNNRSTSVFIVCNGVKKTVSEFAKQYGIGRSTIEYRIKSGWTIEEAVLTPISPKITDNEILNALKLIESGMSIRKAAIQLQIPRSTLRNKIDLFKI